MTTISIITATYNAAPTIADCLASVHAQQHTGTGTCGASPLVEHIIIDGASTDNTLDIVQNAELCLPPHPASGHPLPMGEGKKCVPSPSGRGAGVRGKRSPIPSPLGPLLGSRILSEPDNGIYDAMNKGIRLATGDIIGILNADDFYASPDVLAKVAAVFEDPAVEACYGDLEYIRDPGPGNRKTGLKNREPDKVIHNSKLRGCQILAFRPLQS